MAVFLLVVGMVLLVLGAELLVRGASALAERARISPLVIGLTVVAFGTSAPELAVSLGSAWTGRAELAVGNVVGSNIFNVLLILGLSALVAPLAVSVRLIRLEVPLMILVSVLVAVLGLDGRLGRWDGTALFAGFLLYTFLLIRGARLRGPETDEPGMDSTAGAPAGEGGESGLGGAADLGLVLLGLALLVLGSQGVVKGAVVLAQALGVSELVIGLTVVAGGTSLPELATSVVASFRGQRDIAVGNIVGSNLFNIMSVLGLAAAVAPAGLQVSRAALRFDVPVMITVAVACLPVFFTGGKISRWEGAVFLAYYLAYVLYLILAARHDPALPLLRQALLFFALPLTALTLALLSWRALRGEGSKRRQGP
ncbi:MAG: calcium/sodium antiporter [Acidobacteria bacterium]|nr:calcium/sodium antiporter [Acidobacteriota bacterium]